MNATTTTVSDPPAPGRALTMRVLVVEDDPTLALVLRRTFEQQGYTVDAADNGQHALACGLDSDYDIILLDAMIPPPDGLSVVRETAPSGPLGAGAHAHRPGRDRRPGGRPRRRGG